MPNSPPSKSGAPRCAEPSSRPSRPTAGASRIRTRWVRARDTSRNGEDERTRRCAARAGDPEDVVPDVHLPAGLAARPRAARRPGARQVGRVHRLPGLPPPQWQDGLLPRLLEPPRRRLPRGPARHPHEPGAHHRRRRRRGTLPQRAEDPVRPARQTEDRRDRPRPERACASTGFMARKDARIVAAGNPNTEKKEATGARESRPDRGKAHEIRPKHEPGTHRR